MMIRVHPAFFILPLCFANDLTAADYYFKNNTAAIALADGGGVQTTVFSVVVPAGTWIVQAKTSLVNFGTADFVRCTILVGSTNVNGAGTMIGLSSGMPAVATIANLALTTTAVPKVFKLTCFHDADTPGLYVDPDGAFLVTRAPGTS